MAVAETSLLERAFFSFPDGHEGGRKVIDISVEGSNEEYMHCGSKGGIGGENEEGVSGKVREMVFYSLSFPPFLSYLGYTALHQHTVR